MDTVTRPVSRLRCTPRGSSSEVLRGGRYDDIGKAFGRARPAVGFSIYLRELAELAVDDPPHAILAPADSDQRLRALIAQLRRQGRSWFSALRAKPIAPKKANSYSIALSSVAVRRGKSCHDRETKNNGSERCGRRHAVGR